uniref:Ribosomal RNA-processing protein 40 n=1 Tax=Steinernema glaseri TaxID=37863 RepID=A0A1I7Z8S2_9BILA
MSGRILLPGDLIPECTVAEGAQKDPRVVGCGIIRKDNFVTANRPGLLREDGNKQWLRVSSRKYWPQTGDHVLGIITAKSTDSYKVDIASAEPANISMLNFEGATKRNKPTLKEGDLIYARVIVANKHLEPELTCVDEENRARGLGGLTEGGYNFLVPLDVAHRLLFPQYPLINLIGRDIKFEITVGVNGRIWVNAPTSKEILAIRKMILDSENIDVKDIKDFVDRSIAVMKGVSTGEPMEH